MCAPIVHTMEQSESSGLRLGGVLVCTRGRCIWNCNRYLNDRGQRDGHLSLVASRPRQRVFLSIHPFLCRSRGTPCRRPLRARRLHRSRAPSPTQRPPAHITDPDPDTHNAFRLHCGKRYLPCPTSKALMVEVHNRGRTITVHAATLHAGGLWHQSPVYAMGLQSASCALEMMP